MKNNSFIFWATCFILILPILVLPPSFQPSDWDRASLFKTTLAVLAFFLLYRFFYKNDLSISLPKWNLKNYLPFLALLFFILSAGVATIFSQDPRFSFFSSPARPAGFLNLLFFFAFSIFLAVFINDTYWKKLWSANLAVAFIASVFAIIQAFGVFGNVFTSYYGGGTPSFLGNSTFLAIYMVFMVFWTLAMLMLKKEKKQKFIYGGLLCLFLLTVFLTGSRAVYLALLISFFFFFFFYPLKFKHLKTLKIAAGSLLLLAVIFVLIFNFFPQFGEKNYFFSRLENRLSIQRVSEDLFGTRFAVWKITWQAIKEKPLLGWGPENFYIGFEKYYEPTAPNMQKLWWDKPHNIFLEIWVNLGIFALIFYIAFWILLFLNLQKIKKRTKLADGGPTPIIAHCLQAIIIGYLTALFFNLESFSTHLVAFFFIGYAFYLLSDKNERFSAKGGSAFGGEFKNNQKIINSKNKKIFATVFIVVLLLFAYFWNLKPLIVNETLKRADILSQNKKNCGKAIALAESANKSPGIISAYAALTYYDIIKKCATPEKEVESAKKGVETLKKATAIQPKFTRAWLLMGALENVLAAREEDPANKNKLVLEARGHLNQALELSPKRQEILLEMQKNYMIVQDYKAMEKTGYDCISIDPSQGICYWYLGIAEIFLGNQESGKKHVEQSLEKLGFAPFYMHLGAAYISQKNYVDAEEAYRLAVFNDQKNANYRAVHALLLREIGDYTKAAEEAVNVFDLQPDNPEAIVFLENLLGLDANDPVIHGSLAHIYRQLGREDKAIKELLIAKNLYLNLIRNNPNSAMLRYNLAVVYKELQEYENAYQEALTAVKIDMGYKNKVTKFMETLSNELYDRYLEFLRDNDLT
ncbi:MAG: O-antigen ligase family protein [Candidatus Staskawiczbacteria bacterium]|nr:O-antigen ligase family protein [Candidatus Staskawiczbacteria bacterium]